MEISGTLKKKGLGALAFAVIAMASAQTPTTDNAKSVNEVVTNDRVEWGRLNPLRGDKSPAAGKLWGDRTQKGPSGFLVKFKKGFSSPPHIHNVTYRGVVIQGLLHNNGPKAKEMWMPAGSFWSQPAGEAHITAADGKDNMAYIEIQEGPYLVKPTEGAFDNGERPENIHKSNLVWLNASDISWVDNGTGIKTAFLWGSHSKEQLRAALVKLPAGFKGEIYNEAPNFRAVVIQGSVEHRLVGNNKAHLLEAGSYFGAAKNSAHKIIAKNGGESIVYIRTNGKFRMSMRK